jgi:hypothetical protein
MQWMKSSPNVFYFGPTTGTPREVVRDGFGTTGGNFKLHGTSKTSVQLSALQGKAIGHK